MATESAMQRILRMLELASSGEPAKVREAGTLADQLEKEPGYLKALITMMMQPNFDQAFMAAICIRNYIRRFWDIEPHEGGVSAEERAFFRANMLKIAFTTTSSMVESQVFAAIEAVAHVDFSESWPTFVEQAAEPLGHPQASSALETASLRFIASVAKRYRTCAQDSANQREIQDHLLPSVEPHMLRILKDTATCAVESQKMQEKGQDLPADLRERLKVLMEQTHLVSQIFHSVVFMDLSEFIEDNLLDVLVCQQTLLTFNNPYLSGAFTDDEVPIEPGILEEVKAQILDTYTLYFSRYAEIVQESKLLPMITTALQLLSSLSSAPYQDGLATSGMKLVATALSFEWSETPNPFTSAEALTLLCEKIIVPNSVLRDTDVEQLEESPLEFLRKDVFGSAEMTRRQVVVTLIRDLRRLYPEQVTTILNNHISNVLTRGKEIVAQAESGVVPIEGQYAMDAAVFLYTALASKGMTRAKGVIDVTPGMAPLAFFVDHFAVNLRRTSPGQLSGEALLKAATLRFCAHFRSQFENEVFVELVPAIIEHLRAPNVIIHTYAAHTLTSLLSTKVDKVPKFNASAVREQLLQAISFLLQLATTSPEAQDNEFIPQCLMQILISLKEQATSVVVPTVRSIVTMINNAVDKPGGNPIFAHYLFEVAGLVINNYKKQLGAEIEALLAPLLLLVEHSSFAGYALQVLALLIVNTNEAKPEFVSCFTTLLDDDKWRLSPANAQGLATVFTAFASKASLYGTLFPPNLQTLLERFSYCLSHRRLIASAFEFVNSLIQLLPLEALSPHMKPLVFALLSKVQRDRNPKLLQEVAYTLCLLVLKTGGGMMLTATLNEIQTGLHRDFYVNILFPQIKLFQGRLRRRVGFAAMVQLCVVPEFAADDLLLAKAAPVLGELMGVLHERRTAEQWIEELHRQQETAQDEFPSEDAQAAFNRLNSLHLMSSDQAAMQPNLEVEAVRLLLQSGLRDKASQVDGLATVLNECEKVASAMSAVAS